MGTDSVITLIGTAVTIISTGISLWQVQRAKTYKDQARLAVKKLDLSRSIERLRGAQESVRQLPQKLPIPRGFAITDITRRIQEQFDHVVGELNSQGPAANARSELQKAQEYLYTYNRDLDQSSINHNCILNIQTSLQDAITAINNAIEKMGE